MNSYLSNHIKFGLTWERFISALLLDVHFPNKLVRICYL